MSQLPDGVRKTLEQMTAFIKSGQPYQNAEPPHSPQDADELTAFVCTLFYKAGAKVRIRVVGASPHKGPDADFHHCFTEVFHEPSGKWLSMDPFQATKSWAKDEIWPIE